MSKNDLPLTPLSYQILLALADRPRHGYGIIKEIEERAGEDTAPSTGALYLGVQRMEDEGLIEESGPPADEEKTDARRRYYAITERGREVARAESERLLSLISDARTKKLLPGGTA